MITIFASTDNGTLRRTVWVRLIHVVILRGTFESSVNTMTVIVNTMIVFVNTMILRGTFESSERDAWMLVVHLYVRK